MSHLNSCRFFVLMSQMSALNFFPSFLQTMAREESSDKSAARKGFLHMFVYPKEDSFHRAKSYLNKK